MCIYIHVSILYMYIYIHICIIIDIPSRNQAQRGGKWTIEIGDCPNKTSIQFGDFPLPCLITRGKLMGWILMGYIASFSMEHLGKLMIRRETR